jgi:hypothetical protein
LLFDGAALSPYNGAMQWSKIRTRLRACICPELRKRVDFHLTNYREYGSRAHEIWITVDGEKVFSASYCDYMISENVLQRDKGLRTYRACVVGKANCDYVFTRGNGNQVKDFRETWTKACTAAGVPALLFHDLRRTAARNLRRAGIAEGVIQRIGSWKTRSVFERYAIVTRTDIADAMRKLEAHEREHVTEKGHVSGHVEGPKDQVAMPESIN